MTVNRYILQCHFPKVIASFARSDYVGLRPFGPNPTYIARNIYAKRNLISDYEFYDSKLTYEKSSYLVMSLGWNQGGRYSEEPQDFWSREFAKTKLCQLWSLFTKEWDQYEP